MNRSVTVAGVTYNMFAEAKPNPFTDLHLYNICSELMTLQGTDKIMKAFYLQGGWEAWAQVECALTLRPSHPSIKREQAIYNNSTDLIDLWIQEPGQSKVGIEMKCRNVNFGLENSGTGLPAQVLEDVVKIQRPLKTIYAGARRMFAIGVTGYPLDCVWNSTHNESKWSEAHANNALLNLNTNLKWCRFFGNRSIENDIAQFVSGHPTWTNLYLIWYEA
ncbi:hypothetical protein K505DRAFT_363357 [Melanomma pulvis-pyrius CBS 109.77]|uniref:Uncharacterized protein n=1 Tax=Melanomma pulvis-pyrius CBS 109.77 TaxID=1314802 RepID=A0A6A6X6Z6_9PLEO|nr:hypothetical protein K505DRAFT_363357 [Melanomma pulvis-pyrius CBS 109.77]